MKKQSIQHTNATEIPNNKSIASTIKEAGKNQGRYIYTENDLGEGILDLSVTTSYIARELQNIQQQNSNRA